MKRNAIVVTVIVVASILVTNGLQFFITSKINSRSEAKYKSQIEELNSTITAIGPLQDCWTIKKDLNNKTVPGTMVTENEVEAIKIPESCINESFVMDKYDVVGKFYKIGLSHGTPFTKDMFMEKELDNTVRELDISADVFPIGLAVGDYVDFRLLYPRGEDYIAISHVRVNEINGGTVKMQLNEQQILFYDSATIENFLNTTKGSMTYLAKYTEPGIQEPAKVTYSVPQTIMNLLSKNPNIVSKIENGTVARDVIDSGTQAISSEEAGALQGGRSGMLAKITAARGLYDTVQKEKEEAAKAQQSSAASGEGSGFGLTDANGKPIDLTGGAGGTTGALDTAKSTLTNGAPSTDTSSGAKKSGGVE